MEGELMPSGIAAIPTRLTHEYGLRHPFVGAGMGFIAHERLSCPVTQGGRLGGLGASPDPPRRAPVVVFHQHPPPARGTGPLRTAGIRLWMKASSPELASAAIELGVNGI